MKDHNHTMADNKNIAPKRPHEPTRNHPGDEVDDLSSGKTNNHTMNKAKLHTVLI